MNRKNRSEIWDVPHSKLVKLVKNNDSFSKILKVLGLNPRGGYTATLKQRLDSESIDYSHIRQGKGSNKGRQFGESPQKIPLKNVMVRNSSYNRGHLKRRLLKDGLLKNECSACGLSDEWNNKPLVLILDHKNGINNDHRRSNLRLLCPNCNSQTETFSGRNIKKNAS